MTDPLAAQFSQRLALLRQIAGLGDFQPVSVISACVVAVIPAGTAPDRKIRDTHFQIPGKTDGKIFTQGLASLAAVRKAERENAEFRKFKTLTGEAVEVSRKICRLRPVVRMNNSLQEKNGGRNPASDHGISRLVSAHCFSGAPQ